MSLIRTLLLLLTILPHVLACGRAVPTEEPLYRAFHNPVRVLIQGYTGDAMEPALSADGRYLLFNNLNALPTNTDLFYAERIDDTTFAYRGPVAGANGPYLDAVASIDSSAMFYFISTRSYERTLGTIYRGTFTGVGLTGVQEVPGVAALQPGHVVFDVAVTYDGAALYFSEGIFTGGPVPTTADVILAVRTGSGFARVNAATLAAINTTGLEYAASLSPDGLELFFTRLTGMDASIHRAARSSLSAPFGSPVRVQALEGFVEAPVVSLDGKALYYHRRDADGFHLYRAQR